MIWALLGLLSLYVIGAALRHWLSGSYSGNRYWGLDWDEPENITEITHRLRVPPPSKS